MHETSPRFYESKEAVSYETDSVKEVSGFSFRAGECCGCVRAQQHLPVTLYKLDWKSFRTWNSTKLNWRGYGTLKQTPSLTFRFMIPGMRKYDITSFSSKIKLWWKQATPVPRHKTSFPLTSRQNLNSSPVQKGTKIENPLSPCHQH